MPPEGKDKRPENLSIFVQVYLTDYRARFRSRIASDWRVNMPTYISASDVIPHQVVGASSQNANFPKGNPKVAAIHRYASTRTTAIEMLVKG